MTEVERKYIETARLLGIFGRCARTGVIRLRSPITSGQAFRLDPVAASGVPDRSVILPTEVRPAALRRWRKAVVESCAGTPSTE